MSININGLREAHGQGLTVGVRHENGALRTRLEIDDFIKKKDMFNLYLLALIDLQKYDNWKDRFSYFQIAGIHGKPYVPWDDVRPNDSTIIWDDLDKDLEGNPRNRTNPMAGYCSHGSNLFPTWHRAYLAMLEQTIFLEMVRIAENYPEPYRRRYVDATREFGLPYWDPFLPRRRVINQYGYPIYKCGIPIIMMITQVCVRTPKQPTILEEIPNPLYAYKFELERLPWERDLQFSWEDMFRDVLQAPPMALHTIRGLSPNGTTDHQYVNNTLTNAVSQTNGPAVPLGGKIYRLLNGPPLSYTQMSNSASVQHWADDKEGPLNKENSLEGFHNDLHVLCGTGEGGRLGHMALNEFAAFDPIFFMHHANIDRVCAIWQAMNDSDAIWNWHQPLLENASYITPVGTEETPRTPLVPFRKEYRKIIHEEIIEKVMVEQETAQQETYQQEPVRQATYQPEPVQQGDGPRPELEGHRKSSHHNRPKHQKNHHRAGHRHGDTREDVHHEEDPFQDAHEEIVYHEEIQTIWWTSNDLRHCRSLGYTYPELVQTNSDVRLLRQWVIDNYEWTTICGEPPPLETIFNTEDLKGVEAIPRGNLYIDGHGPPIEIPEEKCVYGKEEFESRWTSFSRTMKSCFVRSERNPTQSRYKHLKGLIKNERLTNWNVTIRVQKFALGGSFTIFVFLGDFPEDPRTWHHHCRLVGIDGIFATRKANMDNCDNCRQQNNNGLVDSDVIALTTPLIAYWKNKEEVGGMKLKSLEREHVIPFLKRNLHWRVLDAQGRQHHPREIPTLKVDVGSQIVRLPYEFGAMPDYEEETIHQNVTNGQ